MTAPLPTAARRKFPAFSSTARIPLLFLALLALLFIALGAAGGNGRNSMLGDILLGCILGLTNAFLGYVFIEKAFRYDSNLFLFISLSGMALRFFLMIASIGFILLLHAAEAGTFIGSFMVVSTMGLTADVLHINASIDRLREAKADIPEMTQHRITQPSHMA